MPAATPFTPQHLARLGALLADPSRAAMLLALMDGTTRPAGELAQAAGIGAATASAHLQRLVAGGLLLRYAQGRNRYFRLASDEIAAWLEAVALPCSMQPIAAATNDAVLRRARTCYRHLAGQLGVAICEAWLQRGWLAAGSGGLRLLPPATAALAAAGWQADVTRQLSTLHGRTCLDWTERRMHIGGALGTALTEGMLAMGWLRRSRHGRALVPSAEGLRQLAALGAAI